MLVEIKELWMLETSNGRRKEAEKIIIFNSSKDSVEESVEEYYEGERDEEIISCSWSRDGEPVALIETFAEKITLNDGKLMRKNFAILNDEDTLNLQMIKDDFRTREEAEEYLIKNNLLGEYYFIAELDDVEI